MRGHWDDLGASRLQRNFELSKCTSCLNGSSQSLEIATNATALRGHQTSPAIEAAGLSHDNVLRRRCVVDFASMSGKAANVGRSENRALAADRKRRTITATIDV